MTLLAFIACVSIWQPCANYHQDIHQSVSKYHSLGQRAPSAHGSQLHSGGKLYKPRVKRDADDAEFSLYPVSASDAADAAADAEHQGPGRWKHGDAGWTARPRWAEPVRSASGSTPAAGRILSLVASPAQNRSPPPGLLSSMVNQAITPARAPQGYDYIGNAMNDVLSPPPTWPAQAQAALNPQTLRLQGRPTPMLAPTTGFNGRGG